MNRSHSIAVISPFLDKKHGTERNVCEQIERLAYTHGWHVHIYSEHVEDVEGVTRAGARDHESTIRNASIGSITWHKVHGIIGPYILRYAWWFCANHTYRWIDKTLRHINHDVTYTPGINCLDADVITVHIVFAAMFEQVRESIRIRNNPVSSWPRLLHRHGYYRMIIALEHFIYGRANTARLIAVSRKTHGDLSRHYHYHRKPEISYHGIDTDRFNPEITRTLRALSRESLGLTDQDFVLLLIGNDWKTKGLPTLLRALSILQLPDVKLLVVGRDIRSPYTAAIAQYKLQDRVSFLPIRRDVEFYYAATDVYVGPSLEDAFALPPAEALACGIATIVSSKAGVSEVITDEVNGIVLKDPRNADELASRLRQLYESPALRQQLGMSGVSLARRLTWDNNALELLSVVESVLGTKD